MRRAVTGGGAPRVVGGVCDLGVLDGVLRFELGVFLAALAVGCGSNLYARWRDRPSAVTRLPALLFLVPGSLGFVSMSGLRETWVSRRRRLAWWAWW